jgi:hypothetical protein
MPVDAMPAIDLVNRDRTVHKLRSRLAAIGLAGVVVALAPLLVPGDRGSTRFLMALLAAILLMKLWDLALEVLRGRTREARDVLRFLVNPMRLVARREGAEHQPSSEQNIRELVGGIAGVALALAAFLLSMSFDWATLPFLVEHGLKAIALFICGVSTLHVLAAVTRMLGGYAPDPGAAPLGARTPAEFWRRYNRIVGEFLHHDVFTPLNGRRHPVRATLMAFAVSGLIHEYLVSMAIGQIQGLQVLFFLVQGIAVVLTSRLVLSGVGARVGQVGTFVFNLVTSLIFFASANEVMRIY